jgi:hypothetical protein
MSIVAFVTVSNLEICSSLDERQTRFAPCYILSSASSSIGSHDQADCCLCVAIASIFHPDIQIFWPSDAVQHNFSDADAFSRWQSRILSEFDTKKVHANVFQVSG